MKITINGTDLTLSFGNYAFKKYNEITKTEAGTIKEFDAEYTELDMLSDLIYCGVYGFAKMNNQVQTLTQADVKVLCNDIDYLTQLEVSKFWVDSVLKMTEDLQTTLKVMGMGGESYEKKK